MRTKVCFLAANLVLFTLAQECLGQTTTFTYQGQLNTSNSPVSGLYDLRFTLYDAANAGSIVGGPLTNSGVAVTNGLFATPVDFGAAAFPGANRWLEIAVRPNGSTDFVLLSRRQPMTASPHAILAAGVADGAISAPKLSPGIGANGQVLKMNGSVLAWGTDLNAGGTVSLVGSGSGLIGGPITSSGTLAIDTSVVPRFGFANLFTGSNTFTGVFSATNITNNFVGVFFGNGAGLTNLAVSGISGILPVGNGGTGASTPGGARATLGAAASGANSDITSLTGLTTPLSPTQGGSGLASYSAGDILYASTANTLARRAAGADGQVLTVSSGFPSWLAANNHNHFSQAWNGVATDGLLVQNNSNSDGAAALTGTASQGSGLGYGVFGQALSTSGVGVQGSAFSTSGTSIGVSGESTSPAGYGVYGLASAGTGANVGVFGETLSTNGIGVYGVASVGSGVGVGVYGEAFSSSGYGLYTPDRLYVGGTAIIGGHLSMQPATRIFAAAGTATFPTFSFSTNSSSGMFSPGTDLLGLVTAGLERFRIAADGKIGVGRVPTANLFELAGEASKNTAGGWLANSDARIKTEVHGLTNALQTIKRVHPVAFRYTDDYRQSHPGIEDKEYHNVIAQEFAEVFPRAVKPSGESLDGKPILQVDTYPAAIYSIAAIQELHELVQSKEVELAKLKLQYAQLEERLNRLESKSR